MSDRTFKTGIGLGDFGLTYATGWPGEPRPLLSLGLGFRVVWVRLPWCHARPYVDARRWGLWTKPLGGYAHLYHGDGYRRLAFPALRWLLRPACAVAGHTPTALPVVFIADGAPVASHAPTWCARCGKRLSDTGGVRLAVQRALDDPSNSVRN